MDTKLEWTLSVKGPVAITFDFPELDDPDDPPRETSTVVFPGQASNGVSIALRPVPLVYKAQLDIENWLIEK